jgi:hypothetical protein
MSALINPWLRYEVQYVLKIDGKLHGGQRWLRLIGQDYPFLKWKPDNFSTERCFIISRQRHIPPSCSGQPTKAQALRSDAQYRSISIFAAALRLAGLSSPPTTSLSIGHHLLIGKADKLGERLDYLAQELGSGEFEVRYRHLI